MASRGGGGKGTIIRTALRFLKKSRKRASRAGRAVVPRPRTAVPRRPARFGSSTSSTGISSSLP